MATTTDTTNATPLLQPSILLDADGHIGDHRPNATTAEHAQIQVSICPASPPNPSRMFVHRLKDPNRGTVSQARIVSAADGLLLLRVSIDSTTAPPRLENDYFIYRCHAGHPSLRRVTKPPRPFDDDEAGLLPLPGGEHFTIAARESKAALSPAGVLLLLMVASGWLNWMFTVKMLPTRDPETGHFVVRVDNWEIYMYTNSKITGAWEDWQLVHRVEASHIDIDQALHDNLLQSGLLHNKTQDGKERNLQNLLISQPALSLDGEDAVYLLTKVKFMQPEAWVLAVDVKGNKIQALAEFGTDTNLGLSLAYCPSRISSYMDAWTTPGTPRISFSIGGDQSSYSWSMGSEFSY